MGDLRLAVRALRATPIVSGVAALSLALGIGANTAIFSLVNSLLLRTLPVAEPQRLVMLSAGAADNPSPANQWTYGTWNELRKHSTAFDGAFAWTGGAISVSEDGDETQPVEGLFVSGGFFATLGVPALIGRTLTPEDDESGGGPDGRAAVISYGLWQRRYGGAASAIGTRLVVNRTPYTIVGVAPPGFFGVDVGRAFDVAVPIGSSRMIGPGGPGGRINTSARGLRIMLRLKPGQSLDAATAALRAVQPQIREGAMPEDFPQLRESFLKDPFTLVPAAAGTSGLRQQYERPLLAIFIVVALVLLIASANIANLLLARADARRHELSVRLALGAPRWRLARQLLIESLVLAGAGAAAGLVFAVWASRALVTQLSPSGARIVLNLPLDWRVLAFTAIVTVTTVLLFGTAPAFRAARVAPIDALKASGRGTSGDSGSRLSGGLVVAQVALSLVLVVAAGLFVRTFERLATMPLGFDRDRVLLVNVNAGRASIAPPNRGPFFYRLVAATAPVPGVAHAAGSMITPITDSFFNMVVQVPGAAPMSDHDRTALVNFITPGWFATYGTALRGGRDFDDRDTATAAQVVVVNDAFVRMFFPGRSAIGATVTVAIGPRGEVPLGSKTIVGVAGDAVYRSLREEVRPTVYLPLAQWPDVGIPMNASLTLSVRAAAGPPAALAHSVAAALTAIDGRLAFSFRPLAERVSASLQQERLIATLSGFFGALALLLAGLGLYGVTAYAVSRRRMEIGIRMALGAAPGRVVRLVLSRVSMLVGIGVVAGMVASVWLSRFVAPLLFGLQPRDPATLAGAAAVLAFVGALAGWLPAWRASRIDPAEVLRES